MTFSDIKQFAPQKIFLSQGSEATFVALVNDVKVAYPLVQAISVPRLTVEIASDIARFAIEGDGTERLIVAHFSVFSPDSAQALLKSLEEPAPDTTIIFMTPYPYIVPQTIRSRVMLMQTTRTAESTVAITQAQALAFIKTELGSDADEDAATRRAKAVAFLDQLESIYKKTPAKADVIYQAKHMLFKANIPTKYVVEYAVSCIF